MKKLWLLAVPVAMSLVLVGCEPSERQKELSKGFNSPSKHYSKCNGKWVPSDDPSCDYLRNKKSDKPNK